MERAAAVALGATAGGGTPSCREGQTRCGLLTMSGQAEHRGKLFPVADAASPAAPARQPVLAPVPPATFSVVVSQLPVAQLLAALARDARMDVDLHPGLRGRVSLKATRQTLPQLLERIAGQVSIRYQIRPGLLIVEPDTPYVHEYALDYVNMARKMRAQVSISTSIASAGSGGGAGVGIPNASSSQIDNQADSQVWKTLEQNLRDILKDEGDPAQRVYDSEHAVSGGTPSPGPRAGPQSRSEPADSAVAATGSLPGTGARPAADGASEPGTDSDMDRTSGAVISAGTPDQARSSAHLPSLSTHASASAVIVNAEAGLIAVRANSRQHRRVRQFLQRVQAGISRQVLIEATLVEILLDKSWQTGVDWSRIGNNLANTLDISQSLTGINFGTGPLTTVTFNSNADFFGGSFSATLKLLENFGKTRVLSSPRVTALNNQMALLKVVDEKVYFEIKATRTEATDSAPGRVDYSSNVRSVPIGVMMSVIPQVSDQGLVSLNVRPTITRITSYKVDPTSTLLGSQVNNLVPEIQVREIESTLRLKSGQTVVLGGLMQESIDDQRQGIPGLMHLPLIGRLFSYRNDGRRKTELVIFLRPTIVVGYDAEPELADARPAGNEITPLAVDAFTAAQPLSGD